jgi:hypothetical protein
MKKQIILLFLLSIHLRSYCQHQTFAVNCNDSLLMTIKGKYIKSRDVVYPSSSSVLPRAQQPEAFRRMGDMHNLLLEAYPQPLGLEANWFGKLSNGTFADDVNFSNDIPVWMYYYNCTFLSYTCIQNKPKEVNASADVYDHFKVFVNQMGALQSDYRFDTMTINSRKVYLLNSMVGSWKGYDLYSNPGEHFRAVLISRKGESPLTPVTRKQYLDYCFSWLNNFFDNQVNPAKEMPVRSLEEQEVLKKKALDKIDEDYKNNPKNRDLIKKNYLATYKTDQQLRDETTNKIKGNKEAVIKRYKAEWEKTKAANLLDSAAIIFSPFTVSENTPIFASGPEGGKMLVTANPAYIRKDLPKYTPQFMVMYWAWTSDFPMYGGEQGVYYKKMLESNFPIEKLQAMIDK